MDTISPAPTRTPDGQFAPGCSGNPKGRPIGSRNRASVMAEALESGEPERLIREYADIAHGGDKVALRFCVGRLVPAPRGRTLVLDLPPGTELDFRTGYVRVARAVFDGEITPEEGLTLVRLLAAGKAARYLSPLPLPAEAPAPLAASETPASETPAPETEEEEEPAAWTCREVALLREIARMRMRGADGAPSGGGEAGAPAAGLTAAGGAARAASSPPHAAARRRRGDRRDARGRSGAGRGAGFWPRRAAPAPSFRHRPAQARGARGEAGDRLSREGACKSPVIFRNGYGATPPGRHLSNEASTRRHGGHGGRTPRRRGRSCAGPRAAARAAPTSRSFSVFSVSPWCNQRAGLEAGATDGRTPAPRPGVTPPGPRRGCVSLRR
jgi:hypothetical protein